MSEPTRIRDAFDVLGLSPRFDIERAQVQQAYLRAVSAAHPDLAGGESGARVTAINAARQALEDPEQRAALVLARLGGPGKDRDRSLPDGFLMAMMEAREALEAARASGDRAGVERFRAQAESAREQHLREVGGLLAGATPGDHARLKRVRQELNAWRYIERLLEQIDD